MSYLLLIASVVLGSLLVYFLKPSQKVIRLLLAFSGAYLLSVTILHLLPDLYSYVSDYKKYGILILVGILIQSVLESFSKGAEHGHIHVHKKDKLPKLLFASLCLHAFSEGLPLHHNNENLLYAILIHKLPIAIVLTAFLLQAKLSKRIIFTAISIFALMSPLGLFLMEKFSFIQNFIPEINALIIGVFLHISTVILFESTENHRFNIQKFAAILLGILLTIFTL